MAIDNRGYGVGLLITTHAIVGVQIRAQRGRVEVISRGSVETPPGSVEGSAILGPSQVAQALRNLRSQMNLQTRSASVALLTPGYQMRTLRLPDVPAAERRTLVRGELEEGAVLPIAGGAFDFLWLPVPTQEGRRQVDACVYYTNDATVDETRETLRLAGLRLDTIEPASLAMMRAYLAGMALRQPIALLCPSERHSDLCIHDGSRVRLMRRIPAGWGDASRPSAPSLGDMAAESGEGEPFSFTAPLEEPVDSLEGAAAVGAPGAGLQASSPMTFLVSEVSRSFAFYAREYPDAPRPQALIILGFASVVQDMEYYLADALSIPVSAKDPLISMDLPAPVTTVSGNEQGGYMAAIGTALGDVDAAIPLVDISQQEQVAQARRRAPGVLLVGMAGSAIWMVAAAIASISLTLLEGAAIEENARLTREIERIKQEQAPKLRYQQLLTAAKAAQARSQVPASAVLGRVAASTTPGVSLTSMQLDKEQRVIIEGRATNTGSVQRFALALARGRSVRSPVFEMMKKDKSGELTFRIACATPGGEQAAGAGETK
jgi:Tfp pilus assembly PilM family ATPase